MPIDPRIAMGYQAPQIESPLNQYAKFAQIQSAQQEQDMNSLRMKEAQAASEERNALRQLNPSSPEYGQQLYKVSPQLWAQYAKEMAATRASQAKETQSQTSAAQTRQQMLAQASRDISGNPSDAQIMAHTEDIIASNLFTPEEKAKSKKTQDMLLSMPFEQRKAYLSQQGAGAGDLATKPAAKTDLAKLIEEQQKFQPGTPEYGLYQKAIVKATTPSQGVQVNVGGTPLEKKEQQEKGALNVKDYGEIAAVARAATKVLPALETQQLILDKGFETGFGAGAQRAGASILSALGVKDAEKFAANAETFNAAAAQAVLTKQMEQKGPQTEADASRISATGAQLGNTVKGNRFLIDTAKAQAKKDIRQRNFYDSWWKNNKTYEGAEDAWYAGEGGKSLFESPELKKYVEQPRTGVPLPSAGGARPSSAAPASPLPKSPTGVDPAIWAVMTPEERALWK